MKKIYIYLSILLILINSLFYSSKSYATDELNDYKAVAHSSTWGNVYPFTYNFHRKYWTINNSEGLETSVLTNPVYFFTTDNVTFFKVNGADLIQLILTRGLNIIMQPERATALIQAFFANINHPDINFNAFVQGGVYDHNNNFLGYALNDITGCYYENISIPTDDVDVYIPAQTTTNVKNFYDYYSGTIYPDYINVYPPSKEFIINHNSFYGNSNSYKPLYKEYLSQNYNTLVGKYCYYYVYTNSSSYDSFMEFYHIPDDSIFIYANDAQRWQNFCNYFKLDETNNDFLFTELLNYKTVPSNIYIQYNSYVNNNVVTTYDRSYYTISNNEVVIEPRTGTHNYLQLGHSSITNGQLGSYQNVIQMGDNFTIYKSLDIYNSINVNKTYEPQSIVGSNYYNYNENNDNSIKTTITQIDNSSIVNETIYNDNSSIVNDNSSSDGYIDRENIIVNIDVAIEQQYPTQNTPDNPTNPDNPTDPDNPIEDGTILDAILAALKRFFDAIGKILGTILAGLLEVIDSVLEAIAGIMENLTGVTDFISALFSWIPSPVPQILGVGISICILAAIFKFIRG